MEDGPEKERKKQGLHQPGLETLKLPGDTAVCFHSVYVCARARVRACGLTKLSNPMVLDVVSIRDVFGDSGWCVLKLMLNEL